MGFPEEECQAALRAANGNSSVAVEFLMSGIPPQVQQQVQSGSMPAAGSATAPSTTGSSLDALL